MTERVEDISQATKKGRFENYIDNNTPECVKRFFSKLISFLPDRIENWLKSNKMKAVFWFFVIRGLFFRPSMWVLYAAMFAYFQ